MKKGFVEEHEVILPTASNEPESVSALESVTTNHEQTPVTFEAVSNTNRYIKSRAKDAPSVGREKKR